MRKFEGNINGKIYTDEKEFDEEARREVSLETRVTKDTVPAFIWHTSTDDIVDVNNTFRYAERLHELGVQMEMHIYPTGTHGVGLANVATKPDRIVPYLQKWPEQLKRYLALYGYLTE